MITIVPYSLAWPAEFKALAASLRAALGALALRIDHIGSTAVPNLPAKDILDIQITAASLDPAIAAALSHTGFKHLPHIHHDHLPPGAPENPDLWQKAFFKSQPPLRPVNLHLRLAGHPNQRYPLLFRDYLRAHPVSAQAYAQMKTALARHHPEDLIAYCDIKDPACDLILTAAESWATQTGWKPARSDA